MTKRVIFVDDDPNLLEGLRHRMFRQRSRWDMRFVMSGREALEVMAREPVDVIVSDMRMPEMDGATLLAQVQERYPRVVRIALSGHAEMETALRAVPVAHQFLAKPSDAGVIENVIERACSLQALIDVEAVRGVVGRIDKLPSVPRIYFQLTAALAKENVSVQEIARILKQDMAMCAKILQIVNSAFFRLSRSISRIEEAVTYLGFGTIKEVSLAVEVFEHSAGKATRIPLDELQAHALLVANLAASFFKEKGHREDAFVAGLLHDVGKLLLVVELPEQVDQVLAEMAREKCPYVAAEERLWGVTHAEVGAYLLGLWGLPYSIVEAVANHHAPARVDTRDFGVLAATYVANCLADDEVPATGTDGTQRPPGLDLGYLESIGVADRLPEWREFARQKVKERSAEK